MSMAETQTLPAPSAGWAARMTPELLRGLPDAARHLFQQAVTDGVGAVFTCRATTVTPFLLLAIVSFFKGDSCVNGSASKGRIKWRRYFSGQASKRTATYGSKRQLNGVPGFT